MAVDGYRLFREMFKGTLMDWLESLLPGHRVNLVSLAGTGVIPNIPFGLMYVLPLPGQGDAIDPMGFAGLRFRLQYSAHDVAESGKALMPGSTAQRVNILYWGDDAADPVLREADVQRATWTGLPHQTFVPAAASANPRKDVIDTLERPQPSPVATLYFFCHCSVGRGNNVILEFTPGSTGTQAIERTDLGVAKLDDAPLVFANACTTAAADPYIANLLEAEFFSRDCRGFVGTEAKVPVALASRFAEIFFRFFERRQTKEPISAGESMAQSRLFLWTHYRNIGGLFYSYINQYELFMATDAEVEAARAG